MQSGISRALALAGNDQAAPAVARQLSLGAVVGVDDTAASGTLAWKGLPVNAPGTGYVARTQRLDALLVRAAARQAAERAGVSAAARLALPRRPALAPPPFDQVIRAVHALDLCFAFGNLVPSVPWCLLFSQAYAPGRLALSEALWESMRQAIGAFTRRGRPNHPALGRAWPAWPHALVFDASPAALQISLN